MFKALVFLVICSGCITIRPRTSAELVVACEALCKKRKGFEAVVTNIELNYYARMSIVSNTCICKNSETVEIMPEGEAIF